jgi:hypothetical protein
MEDARAGHFERGFIDLDYFARLGLEERLDVWETLSNVPGDKDLPI